MLFYFAPLHICKSAAIGYFFIFLAAGVCLGLSKNEKWWVGSQLRKLSSPACPRCDWSGSLLYRVFARNSCIYHSACPCLPSNAGAVHNEWADSQLPSAAGIGGLPWSSQIIFPLGGETCVGLSYSRNMGSIPERENHHSLKTGFRVFLREKIFFGSLFQYFWAKIIKIAIFPPGSVFETCVGGNQRNKWVLRRR